VGKQARNASRQVRHAGAVAAQRGRRLRLLTGAGAVVIVGLLVAIVVSLVNAAGSSTPDRAGPQKPVVPPATATANGAVAVGSATAPVKVEVYLDYMCPYCGRFERANGGELERLVAEGTVRLELYPLSFLDKASGGTRYSTRTANAVATVADRAPDKVLAFNNALFARQPAEGTAGLPDDEIAALARSAGVSADVAKLFTDGVFEPWVAASTEAVLETGVSSTPTVKINGKVFQGDLFTVGPLTQAVAAATGR